MVLTRSIPGRAPSSSACARILAAQKDFLQAQLLQRLTHLNWRARSSRPPSSISTAASCPPTKRSTGSSPTDLQLSGRSWCTTTGWTTPAASVSIRASHRCEEGAGQRKAMREAVQAGRFGDLFSARAQGAPRDCAQAQRRLPLRRRRMRQDHLATGTMRRPRAVWCRLCDCWLRHRLDATAPTPASRTTRRQSWPSGVRRTADARS